MILLCIHVNFLDQIQANGLPAIQAKRGALDQMYNHALVVNIDEEAVDTSKDVVDEMNHADLSISIITDEVDHGLLERTLALSGPAEKGKKNNKALQSGAAPAPR